METTKKAKRGAPLLYPRRVQMSLMIDTDVRRKLRLAAADEERQMSEIANDALRAALGLQREPKPAA